MAPWSVPPADDRLDRDCPDLLEQLSDPIRDRHTEQVQHEEHERNSG